VLCGLLPEFAIPLQTSIGMDDAFEK